MSCRSYGKNTKSSEIVELIKDVSMPLTNRDVLIVEDIVDTGLTTSFLYDHLALHQPNSLRLVTFLNKKAPRLKKVRIDFQAFEIPDKFVIGYGLDLAEKYRDLPDIHLLKEE